jgi:hypothetical protein
MPHSSSAASFHSPAAMPPAGSRESISSGSYFWGAPPFCHHTNDPDELLRFRFLCRRGLLLLCGPTGIGKSSFAMQCMILWALGLPAFGIAPVRPLKSLLIQAENDEGDLAEMREMRQGNIIHSLTPMLLELTLFALLLASSALPIIAAMIASNPNNNEALKGNEE